MRGESHLKAGHALRQSRHDRRSRQGYRRNNNKINIGHDQNGMMVNAEPKVEDDESLNGPNVNGVDAAESNGSLSPKTVDATIAVEISNKALSSVTEEQPKEANKSQKKKKGYWSNRRYNWKKRNGKGTNNAAIGEANGKDSTNARNNAGPDSEPANGTTANGAAANGTAGNGTDAANGKDTSTDAHNNAGLENEIANQEAEDIVTGEVPGENGMETETNYVAATNGHADDNTVKDGAALVSA